ncbi:TPA: ATP-binding cassette domain-containing protein [Klebsiella pneumoniae]|nr:ATP-binding cassette domain-containing protein [Klebsiella pneumoniae]
MNHKTEIPVLTVDDVCVTFPLRYSLWERLHGYPRRAVQALNGVHLTLRPGETLGIVGESGCGKSTLARALVGLNGTSHGEIHFHGQNIASLRGRARRDFNRRVQMIFQDPYGSLNPRMTVVKWSTKTGHRVRVFPVSVF